MSRRDESVITLPTVTNTKFGCEIRERNIEHALEQAIALMREGEPVPVHLEATLVAAGIDMETIHSMEDL